MLGTPGLLKKAFYISLKSQHAIMPPVASWLCCSGGFVMVLKMFAYLFLVSLPPIPF